MKKIIFIIALLFISSCTWNYKNGDIQNNIDAQEAQELEDELLALQEQKAKEILEKIELENEIASEVLQNFLESDDFDIKAEIERTKKKYGDTLGPILEYEHEKIPEDEIIENNSGSTFSGTTNTGTTMNEEGVITDVYSGEVIIVNEDTSGEVSENNTDPQIDEATNIDIDSEKESIEESEEFTTSTKVGRSGTYTMYQAQGDSCNGGLEMKKNDGTKSWLFMNNCEQKIYNFTLAVGGINVFYRNSVGTELEQFVSLN